MESFNKFDLKDAQSSERFYVEVSYDDGNSWKPHKMCSSQSQAVSLATDLNNHYPKYDFRTVRTWKEHGKLMLEII